MTWDVEYTNAFGDWWVGLAEGEPEDIRTQNFIRVPSALVRIQLGGNGDNRIRLAGPRLPHSPHYP